MPRGWQLLAEPEGVAEFYKAVEEPRAAREEGLLAGAPAGRKVSGRRFSKAKVQREGGVVEGAIAGLLFLHYLRVFRRQLWTVARSVGPGLNTRLLMSSG